MFIPYFRPFSLVLPVLLLSFSAQADIYKWVDEDNQPHYSEQPPADGQAKLFDVPAPPSRLNSAQIPSPSMDMDNSAAQTEWLAQRQANIEDSCQRLQTNLQHYQGNSDRDMSVRHNNAVRLSAEDRHRNIEDLQQQIQLYCQ